jgi:hypothetical protein
MESTAVVDEIFSDESSFYGEPISDPNSRKPANKYQATTMRRHN